MKLLLKNEQIKAPEVRLIDDDGSKVGIMACDDAKSMALSKQLDLVMLSPNADPPVCKIMDYGKYIFVLMKKEKEAKKKQKTVEFKEIRFSVKIDDHDFNTKVGNATKLLKAGYKIKLVIRFRGREITHSNIGFELLQKFSEKVAEFGDVDKPAKLEGKTMMMFIAPKKS